MASIDLENVIRTNETDLFSPDLSLEELAERDSAQGGGVHLARRLEELLEDAARAIRALQTRIISESEIHESRAATGQTIRPGNWIHLADNGRTAYLATATVGAGNYLYYASALCISSSVGGKVLSVDLASGVKGMCLPFTNNDCALFLSSSAGWATDTPPARGTGKMLQEVGQKRGILGDDGLCSVKVNCMGTTRR